MTTRAAQSIARPAFSLIELLVSIGIIAVLIGILLPALSGAMESARSVRCQVNLRSLVTGLQMYQEDNDGVIPWAIVTPNTIDDPEPFLSLTSYLDAALPQGTAGEDVTTVDPFACPSDRIIAPLTGFSYVYLPASFMQTTSEEPENLSSWRRLTRFFESPGSFEVFHDFRRYHLAQRRWPETPESYSDLTGYNFVYLDGSITKDKRR